MRSILLGVVCLSTVVACGAAEPMPHDIADDLFRAVSDGDNVTWRALHDADAMVAFPDGATFALFGASRFVVDDFDGDGVAAPADDFQFRQAMHDPADQQMTWQCFTLSETVAECSVTATDAFIRAGGADPMTSQVRLTIEDGLVTLEEFLEPEDPAGIAATHAAHSQTMSEYQEWVRTTYPEEFGALFNGPCCSAPMVGLPEAVTRHADLMDEFFARSQ